MVYRSRNLVAEAPQLLCENIGMVIEMDIIWIANSWVNCPWAYPPARNQ